MFTFLISRSSFFLFLILVFTWGCSQDIQHKKTEPQKLISRGDEIDDLIICLNQNARVFPLLGESAFAAKFLRGHENGEIILHVKRLKFFDDPVKNIDLFVELKSFQADAIADLYALTCHRLKKFDLAIVLEGFDDHAKNQIKVSDYTYVEAESVFSD